MIKGVEKLAGYVTTDGNIFAKEVDADVHQAELNFKQWYEDNKLYGDVAGCKIDWPDLIAYLQEHDCELVAFMYLMNPKCVEGLL